MAPFKQTIVVGGLFANVYSEAEATPASRPVSILVLMHGRHGSAQHAEPWVNAIFRWISGYRSSNETAEDLIIVTLVRVSWSLLKIYVHPTSNIESIGSS